MAAVGRPVGAQRQSQRRVCIRFGLLFCRRKQLVALLPVAPEMRQLKVGKVAGMPALGHGNDVVDARRKRMRKLAAEIHRFAADAAHGLCSIDLLFVALKGQTVRAVTVWARNSLWHVQLLGHSPLCTHRAGDLCRQGGLLRGGSVFKAHGRFADPGVSKKPLGKPNGRRFAVSAQLPAAAAYWAGWDKARLAVCCHALRMMLQ